MRSTVIRRSSLVVAIAATLALIGGQAAIALDEPTVPEPVATYFASGLIQRVADLYGPGKKADSGIVFDTTAKVGDIHRVFAWTKDFLARTTTKTPMQLTNNWVAPISVKGRAVGLATVWINPASDNPELANFDLGPGLVTALAEAPKGEVLVRDDTHSAWFATDGTKLIPLVSGTSGIAAPTTIAVYQKTFPRVAPSAPVSAATTNQGLVIAGVVLLIVVILLALFVVLPGRRRRARGEADDRDAPPVSPETDGRPEVTEPAAVIAVEAAAAPTAVAPAAAAPVRKAPAARKAAVKKPVAKPSVPPTPPAAAAKSAAAKTAATSPTAPKPPRKAPAQKPPADPPK